MHHQRPCLSLYPMGMASLVRLLLANLELKALDLNALVDLDIGHTFLSLHSGPGPSKESVWTSH